MAMGFKKGLIMQTTGHIQIKPASSMFATLGARAKFFDLTVNAFSKHLLALALNNLDVRFYPLVRTMAQSNKNIDSFEQCADHIGAFLEGALSNLDKIDENKRARLIFDEGLRYIRNRNHNFVADFDTGEFSPSDAKFYRQFTKV